MAMRLSPAPRFRQNITASQLNDVGVQRGRGYSVSRLDNFTHREPEVCRAIFVADDDYEGGKVVR